MPIENGKILLDKYKILRRLGSGAWGDVYLAQDIKLGRQVAIKQLKGELAEDEIALKRFLREARAIAALKHRNVVIIYALERENENHYIVMEYAEKGSLEDLLKEATSLSISVAFAQSEAKSLFDANFHNFSLRPLYLVVLSPISLDVGVICLDATYFAVIGRCHVGHQVQHLARIAQKW